MGEAAVDDVLGQLRRDRPIGAERGLDGIAGTLHPGAQMHLVDGHRRIQRLPAAARCHPVGVLPLVVQVPDDRSRPRRQLGREGEGIGLVHLVAVVSRNDVVLVAAIRPGRLGQRPSQMPETPWFSRGWLVFDQPLKSPITDTRSGIGRPNGEIGARRVAGLRGCAPSFS